MRIPSGTTDRYIYFVAVDATDLTTRETGLATWTVYYEIENGTATAMTTPTITEASSANMPGVYTLLIDESGMTTLAAGHDTAELCLHITHAGMAPVTRVIEIYRAKFTEGQAATMANNAVDADLERIAGSVVSTSTAQLGVNVVQAAGTAWNSGAIGAGTVAAGSITASKFAANALDAVWSTATRVLTAGTNIALAKGTGVTGFNDLDAAGVRTAVGLASANLDTQLTAIDDFLDTEIAAIKAKTDNLPSDPADASVIAGRFDTVDASIAALPTADVSTDVTAIKAKTDSLTFTTAGQVDANVQYVNDVEVTGVGSEADPWGP